MRCAMVAALVLVAACSGSTGESTPALTAIAANGHVERVVDGDTVVVRMSGASERVRLIGVDTPETVDERRPVECFGREASAFTAGLLPPGTPVLVVRDVEARDAYDRLLGYVYRSTDGLFVNLELAEQGFAELLTIPPNVAHAEELRAAARRARTASRGLWSACRTAPGADASR